MKRYKLPTEIIAFVSGKGGVGKTIIAANLAALLAKSGIKTLLVDSDFATRGLTFYLLKGKKEIDKTNCYFDYLIGEVNLSQLRPLKIQEKFYLLPAISLAWIETPEEKLQDSVQMIYQRLSELVSKLRKSFDVIIFDTRSGADPISLIPAELSDRFVVVSEEDFTSWRTSIVMRDSIKKYAADRGKAPSFTGFVLNRVIEEQHGEIISFLESRWFETKMLAVILHEAKVKRAFLTDDLVIERFPDSEFSSIICDIALELFKRMKEEKRENILRMREFYVEAKEVSKQKERKPILRLRIQSFVFIYLAIVLIIASFWFKSEIFIYIILASFVIALGWITFEVSRMYELLSKKLR